MTATKDQIYQAAINALSEFPTVALRVQAGDPTVLAQIGAQVSMLAEIVDQVEVGRFEAFNKTRDSTVLADASLKGILPLARACRVSLSVKNEGTAAFTLAAGRRFQDKKGRIYQADSAATIAAGATVAASFTQITLRTVTHTVAVASPFYEIEVPFPTAGVYLNSLAVAKGAQAFTYAPDWFNVLAGDFAYNLLTDEQRRPSVVLGSAGVLGYGVTAGEVFTLTITECEGAITDLAANDSFSLEYIYSEADGRIKATLASVLDTGANPPSMSELKVLAQYPAIYDHNAVYLAEFDFLLRRYLGAVRFLSVWNEQIEESVRGASVLNTNTLFIAGTVPGMTNTVFQDRVRSLIKRADNSYKVKFVAQADYPVPMTVTARVSVVHDAAAVEDQIRDAVLAAYGVGTPAVSRGMSNPLRKQVTNELLKKAVPALQDERADFEVTFDLPDVGLPEQFIHITAESLSVDVQRADFGNAQWNY